jgi:hypothetical protein
MNPPPLEGDQFFMSPDRAHEAVGARGTESLQTPRWRGLDSNFQYAGAVNLIVAPFADRLFRLLDATSRVDGASPGYPPFSHGHRQPISVFTGLLNVGSPSR